MWVTACPVSGLWGSRRAGGVCSLHACAVQPWLGTQRTVCAWRTTGAPGACGEINVLRVWSVKGAGHRIYFRIASFALPLYTHIHGVVHSSNKQGRMAGRDDINSLVPGSFSYSQGVALSLISNGPKSTQGEVIEATVSSRERQMEE